MKATGIPRKCRAGDAASSAPRPAAAHVPLRRPGANSSLHHTDGADREASVAAPATSPRDPLVMHRPGTALHVLHIDQDSATAVSLAVLLMPEIRVTHVRTIADAYAQLLEHNFSAVVIDPTLPDGDAAVLLPALTAIPLLVYSAEQPAWRERSGIYLPKPWTSPRRLWTTISSLLGIPSPTCAGD